MSKSKIIITPSLNIKDYSVIDNDLVTSEIHDSRDALFTFRNVVKDKTRTGALINVSLYDDVIVRNNIEYKILHMLTKPTFNH